MTKASANLFTPGTKVKGLYLDCPFEAIVVSSRTHSINWSMVETTVELTEPFDFMGHLRPVGHKMIVATDHEGNHLPSEGYGISRMELAGQDLATPSEGFSL